MEHSKRFEELKDKYEDGFCTAEQLKQYKKLQVITTEEYQEITGESYMA